MAEPVTEKGKLGRRTGFLGGEAGRGHQGRNDGGAQDRIPGSQHLQVVCVRETGKSLQQILKKNSGSSRRNTRKSGVSEELEE